MKTRIDRSLSYCATLCCSAFLVFAAMASAANAQTFTSLLSFTGNNGAQPVYASLVQGTNGNFYGTTSEGGSGNECGTFAGCGTVFEITPSGVLTVLHNFCSASNCPDGAEPDGGLVLGTDGNFYGTTSRGGANGIGTVFKITPSGVLTTLKVLGAESQPADSLVEGPDGNFYGTTQFGGANGLGTVFKITPQGTLTVLHSFGFSEGQTPESGLILGTDGNFYGTTYTSGTPGGYGSVFKITPAGQLTSLHFFDDNDGDRPQSVLVEGSNGTFYGTASAGGTSDDGTLFSITSAGKFTLLHNFDGTDGLGPNQLLLATNGNFYGTTKGGGSDGDGVVFKATSQGSVTVVHNFDGNDGNFTFAGVTQSTDGHLFGVTMLGGSEKIGAAFRMAVGLGPSVITVPTVGKVGTSAKVLGTNLAGATKITFNGIAATFKVVSGSAISVTVPPGATTGAVKVVTPQGTIASQTPFQVQ